jgi:membrane fusion protein, multidrug efflux system
MLMIRTQPILRFLPVPILLGFLAACGSKEQAQKQTPPELSGVSVETIRQQSTPEYYEAVGTVKAKTSSVLGAEISGTVRRILVKEGDRVRRGQLLAVLDDRTERAQLAAAAAGIQASSQGLVEVNQSLQAATADRQFAEATFHRYKELLAKDSVSRQEYDNAETQYKGAVAHESALKARAKQMAAQHQQAQAQHASAEAVFSYSRIVSPIDGVVTSKSVDEGTLVMPGTPLLTVEDTGHFRLEASVPAHSLGMVRIGQPVPVSIGSLQIQGRVVEIVPAADSNTRTFTVKVELPGSCDCQSGQYGKAEISTGEQNRLLVPRDALVSRGELEGLFVVNSQGIAQYQLVKTGRVLGDQVEILSGLADGERIAVSKVDRLSDGMRVETK